MRPKIEDYKTTGMFQDIGGQSLDRLLERSPLTLVGFLELSVVLADTVGSLHKRHIIHKNINPSHVIFNPATRQVNLVGFGLADEPTERSTTLLSPSAPEGPLAYISPEQTGRMNRPVDYRTDLYSLGATFYRMLTGKLPFDADDTLGMVHSHIARTPVPPNELNPDIPEMVSLIVMKLMSKMADDRYQSAHGLKADLEKCLCCLRDEGIVRNFEIGLEDFSDQLQFPERLHGRKQEIGQLLDSFKKTCSGKRELLLVSGYAGVGKTVLVQELYGRIAEAGGYFIKGKFDQLQRNIPYFAWIQAFNGLVNSLLMENETQIAKWRELIMGAVGNAGQVLTDIIPNLEHIIGSQPEIPVLGAQEALNRMNYVFKVFLRIFATAENPLVVFLDDLQWIDTASLNLTLTLLKDSEISHLLVIGAYRDNEIDAVHPLRVGLETLQKEPANITRMPLHELSENAVNGLISQTLRTSPERTTPLTHLIYSKTGGNPFFLRQTLKALVDRSALAFSATDRCWKWNLSQLEKMEMTDNVVSLMLGKIRRFSSTAQRLLSLAACIGFRFDIHTLGVIFEYTEDRVLEDLQSAVHEGLILFVDDGFQFSHDRIQQAAYSLIPDDEKKKTHLTIGKLLLFDMEGAEHEERLFDVADHLNIGSGLVSDPDERLQFAGLNLKAGLKAKASAAFSAAAKYFDAGVGLLADRNWETDYDLAIALYNASAEAESLLGNYGRADMLFETVLSNARNPVDTAGVYQSRINTLMSQGKLNDAVDCGLELLDRLGIQLKAHPTPEDVVQSLTETMASYDPENIPAFIDLPEMTDPTIRTAMNVMDSILGPAYSGRPFLNATLCFEQIKLIIRNGSIPSMMVSFASYALRLCALPFGDVDQGYEFGRLAVALAGRGNAPALTPKVIPPIVGYLWPYKRHMRDALDVLPPHYPAAKEVGDFEFAGYVTTFYVSNAYLAGVELTALERETASYVEDLIRIRSEVSLRFLIPFLQSTHNLLGKSECPWILDGEACNREELLRVLDDTGNAAAPCAFHVNTLLLCCLFGRYEEALIASNSVEEHRAGLFGLTMEPIWFFYDSLTRIALYPKASKAEKEAFLERVAANQAYLHSRARHAPMNFLNKWHLVEAEKEKALGNGLKAMEHYDQAISLARENGFLQEEALANEATARFHRCRGSNTAFRAYLREAHACYRQWGAIAKVRQLEMSEPWLGEGFREKHDPGAARAGQLDVMTIIKAQQAISGEIQQDNLTRTLLAIAMENAGARTGYLQVESGGRLRAEITPEKQDRKVVFDSRPESAFLPEAIVNYVRHSRKRVILADAKKDAGEFASDTYLRQVKPRSVLCMPIQRKDRLLAVLHLENNLAAGVFTAERCKVLEMLAAQAAISLETSGLYETVRTNEARFRLGQTAGHIGIWEYDIASECLWGSDEAKAICGFDPEVEDFPLEMVESRIPERERVHQVLMDLIEHNRPYDLEFEILPADGSAPKIVSAVAELYRDDQGRPVKVLGVIQDISRRKRAEEALHRLSEELEQRVRERTVELERSNEDLEQFAYVASHDLQEPLRKMAGFAGLLARRYRSRLDAKAGDYIDYIVGGASRMQNMINDLMRYSRVTTRGKEPTPTDCNVVIRHVMEDLEFRIRDSQAAVACANLPTVMADESQLVQLFQNLIGNALKYHGREPLRITIGAERKGNEWQFFVRDNGIGLESQYAERIFVIFQRLHTRDEYEGTGIGLAICKRIVERHGGRIWVESEPGRGAVFFFTLPDGSRDRDSADTIE